MWKFNYSDAICTVLFFTSSCCYYGKEEEKTALNYGGENCIKKHLSINYLNCLKQLLFAYDLTVIFVSEESQAEYGKTDRYRVN